jgi:hypothetical protein
MGIRECLLWLHDARELLKGSMSQATRAKPMGRGAQVGEERLSVADIDPSRIGAARHSFDPTGHYARPDVFQVLVDRRRELAATFTD